MQNHSALEPIVYVGANMTRAASHAIGGGTALVFSARSPAKETENEDAAALLPFDHDSAVLVVADGLGGGPAGQRASSLVIETLAHALSTARLEDAMLRTAILNGLESANQAIQDLRVGAATTVAVVEIRGRTVRSYHAGDSTIAIVGQRGKIKLQTTSHSPVGFAVEAGVLNEQEAMFHDQRHVVSNVVGAPQMSLEIGSQRQLHDRDTILLASDGLCDNLHFDEIVARIRKGALPQAAGRLVEDATSRMLTNTAGHPSKPDDLTFILFRPRAPRTPPARTPSSHGGASC